AEEGEAASWEEADVADDRGRAGTARAAVMGRRTGEAHRRRELDCQHDVVGRLRALVVDLDEELERAANGEQWRIQLEARAQDSGRSGLVPVQRVGAALVHDRAL